MLLYQGLWNLGFRFLCCCFAVTDRHGQLTVGYLVGNHFNGLGNVAVFQLDAIGSGGQSRDKGGAIGFGGWGIGAHDVTLVDGYARVMEAVDKCACVGVDMDDATDNV